jgi:hypothetical protein
MTGKGMSQTDYAAHRGVGRRTVRDWIAQGRLVMTGKRIDPTASDAALDGTEIAAELSSLPTGTSRDEAERQKALLTARRLRGEVLVLADGHVEAASIEAEKWAASEIVLGQFAALPEELAEELAALEADAKREAVAVMEQAIRGRLFRVAELIDACGDPEPAPGSVTASLEGWRAEELPADCPRAEAERLRVLWQARRAWIELRLTEGELIEVEAVRSAAFGLARATRDRLLGLPVRLADRVLACAGDRAEIEAVIVADLEPVLEELAANTSRPST